MWTGSSKMKSNLYFSDTEVGIYTEGSKYPGPLQYRCPPEYGGPVRPRSTAVSLPGSS